MAQKFSGLYSNPLRKVNHMLVYKVEIFLFEPLFLIICFQYYTVAQFLKFSTYTDYDDLSGLDIDFTDGEQLLLWEELRRITDKLADVEEYISYLNRPITEVSRLRKGTAGKYRTAKGHYYDCCSSIEALVTDEYHDVPYWTRTTVEHNGEDYYLVGYKGLPMEGLRVRVRSAA